MREKVVSILEGLEDIKESEYYQAYDNEIVICKSVPTYYFDKMVSVLRRNNLINLKDITINDDAYVVTYNYDSEDVLALRDIKIPAFLTSNEKVIVVDILNSLTNELCNNLTKDYIFTMTSFNDEKISVEFITNSESNEDITNHMINEHVIDNFNNINPVVTNIILEELSTTFMHNGVIAYDQKNNFKYIYDRIIDSI